MFSSSFQTGESGVEIISASGSKLPSSQLLDLSTSGVSKEYDRDIKGYCFRISKSATAIQCPTINSSKKSLGLTQPLLAFQIQCLADSPLSLELSVLDTTGRRRRLHLSTNFHKIEANNELHCQIPWTNVSTSTWSNYIINLMEYTSLCFQKAEFQCLESFKLKSLCRFRKIYTLPFPKESLDIHIPFNFEFPVPLETPIVFMTPDYESFRTIKDQNKTSARKKGMESHSPKASAKKGQKPGDASADINSLAVEGFSSFKQAVALSTAPPVPPIASSRLHTGTSIGNRGNTPNKKMTQQQQQLPATVAIGIQGSGIGSGTSVGNGSSSARSGIGSRSKTPASSAGERLRDIAAPITAYHVTPTRDYDRVMASPYQDELMFDDEEDATDEIERFATLQSKSSMIQPVDDEFTDEYSAEYPPPPTHSSSSSSKPSPVAADSTPVIVPASNSLGSSRSQRGGLRALATSQTRYSSDVADSTEFKRGVFEPGSPSIDYVSPSTARRGSDSSAPPEQALHDMLSSVLHDAAQTKLQYKQTSDPGFDEFYPYFTRDTSNKQEQELGKQSRRSSDSAPSADRSRFGQPPNATKRAPSDIDTSLAYTDNIKAGTPTHPSSGVVTTVNTSTGAVYTMHGGSRSPGKASSRKSSLVRATTSPRSAPTTPTAATRRLSAGHLSSASPSGDSRRPSTATTGSPRQTKQQRRKKSSFTESKEELYQLRVTLTLNKTHSQSHSALSRNASLATADGKVDEYINTDLMATVTEATGASGAAVAYTGDEFEESFEGDDSCEEVHDINETSADSRFSETSAASHQSALHSLRQSLTASRTAPASSPLNKHTSVHNLFEDTRSGEADIGEDLAASQQQLMQQQPDKELESSRVNVETTRDTLPVSAMNRRTSTGSSASSQTHQSSTQPVRQASTGSLQLTVTDSNSTLFNNLQSADSKQSIGLVQEGTDELPVAFNSDKSESAITYLSSVSSGGMFASELADTASQSQQASSGSRPASADFATRVTGTSVSPRPGTAPASYASVSSIPATTLIRPKSVSRKSSASQASSTPAQLDSALSPTAVTDSDYSNTIAKAQQVNVTLQSKYELLRSQPLVTSAQSQSLTVPQEPEAATTACATTLSAASTPTSDSATTTTNKSVKRPKALTTAVYTQPTAATAASLKDMKKLTIWKTDSYGNKTTTATATSMMDAKTKSPTASTQMQSKLRRNSSSSSSIVTGNNHKKTTNIASDALVVAVESSDATKASVGDVIRTHEEFVANKMQPRVDAVANEPIDVNATTGANTVTTFDATTTNTTTAAAAAADGGHSSTVDIRAGEEGDTSHSRTRRAIEAFMSNALIAVDDTAAAASTVTDDKAMGGGSDEDVHNVYSAVDAADNHSDDDGDGQDEYDEDVEKQVRAVTRELLTRFDRYMSQNPAADFSAHSCSHTHQLSAHGHAHSPRSRSNQTKKILKHHNMDDNRKKDYCLLFKNIASTTEIKKRIASVQRLMQAEIEEFILEFDYNNYAVTEDYSSGSDNDSDDHDDNKEG